MNHQSHWDRVYATKRPETLSWYQPHLETSLALIESVASELSTPIIDVGGGASTLVDDLLLRGYENVTVLDISRAALQVARRRLGPDARRARWIVADILTARLKPGAYEIWHDRAVFHFLTRPAAQHSPKCPAAVRQAYRCQICRDSIWRLVSSKGCRDRSMAHRPARYPCGHICLYLPAGLNRRHLRLSFL